MAFEGDLTNLGLGDIFQTLGMNRQSGTLVVNHKGVERRFFFSDDGVSLLTSRNARRFKLGNLLVGMGRLSEEDLKVAVLKQERAKGTKIGDLLIQTEMVTDEDIKEACRYQAAEEIYDSFNWKSGKFQFLEGANAGPEGGPGPFAEFFFDVTDVIMEAARRSDEFQMNMDRIGDSTEFLVRNEAAPLDESVHGRAAMLLHKTLDGTMNVDGIFHDFYLSPFDTSEAFIRLIDHDLIHPMSAEDLRTTATPFLDSKDWERAIPVLTRALFHEAEDRDLLESLVLAQTESGLRKEASKTLTVLARVQHENGDHVEGIESLHQATEKDPRNEDAFGLLMEFHAGLDQLGKAENACADAARLRSDDRDFAGALELLDRGLGLAPESLNLRIQHANCLMALGRKDEGIEEMNEVAQILEEGKDEGELLVSVYRKLLQLEPDRKDLKDRIDSIVAGEKFRERRKQLAKVGMALGVAAVLGLAWTLRPLSAADQLQSAQKIVAAGVLAEMDEARTIANDVLEDAEPNSDDAITAQRILDSILAAEEAPQRSKRVKQFRAEIEKDILGPVRTMLDEQKYPDAVRKAMTAFDATSGGSAELKAMAGQDLSALKAFVQIEVGKVLSKAAGALSSRRNAVHQALATVEPVQLHKVDAERQRRVFETADAILEQSDKVDWSLTVDHLEEAEAALGGVEGVRIRDLRRYLAEMESALAALENKWNAARALVRQAELRADFASTTRLIQEAKMSGEIAKGVEACDAFLDKCSALRAEEPAEFFKPVIERLFEVLKLDELTATSKIKLSTALKGLQAAAEAEKAGDLQAAFDTLRKTIAGAQDIRFRAMLPLRVRSRPGGARLFVTLPEGAPIDAGLTFDPLKADGDDNQQKVIKYPYQGKTVLRLEMDGFEPAVIERTGIAGDSDAEVIVELQRHARWRRETGAAIEGIPGLTDDLVLVGTREGLFRGLSLKNGDEQFQLATGHLSGISGGVLVADGVAYFGGNDGEAFAVDLAKKKFLWRKKTTRKVTATPVKSGTTVVFADEAGSLHAFGAKDGKELWKKDLGSSCTGGLAAADGHAVVGLADYRVVAFDLATGADRWTAKLTGPVYSPATLDGAGGVIMGTEASTVVRIGLADGKVTWTTKTGAPVNCRPILHGGGIVFVSSTGDLIRVDDKGNETGRTSLGAPVSGGCHRYGGMLYVTTSEGSLVAFDLDRDVLRWSLRNLGTLMAPPVANGTALVVANADREGNVVVLEP